MRLDSDALSFSPLISSSSVFICPHQYLMLTTSSPDMLRCPLPVSSAGHALCLYCPTIYDRLFWGGRFERPPGVATAPEPLRRSSTDLVHGDDPVGLIWSFPLHEDLLFIRSVLQGLLWNRSWNCGGTNPTKITDSSANTSIRKRQTRPPGWRLIFPLFSLQGMKARQMEAQSRLFTGGVDSDWRSRGGGWQPDEFGSYWH